MPNAFRLAMQLHITGRCNLRCKHCYITERCDDALPLADIVKLIDDFCALVKAYNHQKGIRFPGQINLTGGEPMIREDFWEILAHIRSKPMLRFALLTNGSLITRESAARLKTFQPMFVQVSLDGKRQTHDALRAVGNFDQTLHACDMLKKAGIRTLVSFTANRGNAGEYGRVLAACRRHRVDKLWTDRLVPIGTGEEMAALCMNADEYRDYVQMIRRKQKSPLSRLFPTEVALTRSLQFLTEDGRREGPCYLCSAADSLITVDEHGNIFPCRRLPIRAGNILTDDLMDAYFHSDVMNAVRNRAAPEECLSCRNLAECFGGSLCIAYAATGKLIARDPGCWLNAFLQSGLIQSQSKKGCL